MKLVRGELGEAAASICHERELDAEREMGERLELVVASWYDLLALFPAVAEERRIVADQDNHGDALAELRQDLLDEPRVGLMEADVKGGKRPVTRREVPRFGELALRAWVRELHGFLTSVTGLPALFFSKDIAILQCFKSNCLHAFARNTSSIAVQNHPSQAMRLRRSVTFVASVLLSVIRGHALLRRRDSTPAQAKGKGRVTIVYQDDAIQPENRDAIKKIRDSGVFERMADRLTKAVALPHDLQVVVTDKLPKGFDDPTTETDGGKIWWPAAFSKATHDILTEFLPEVIASKGPPRAISKENFTPDVLNVWGNQFILGHELGHALIHQLNVPLTGMEEDSADGFATFFTVNDKDTGPNAALGAAVLFDAMGSKRPNLTLEDFSSDHPVILQRVYNFLCAVVGSDPQRLQNSLVTDGYIPQIRALLCRKEWTQLNYGWWTLLEPHLTDSSKKETKAARQQARKDLEDENKAPACKIKQVRGGRSGRRHAISR